ncbi:MAG: hypothetical protein COT24_03355 [Candidatus Kerfeldbacteria bacterium CG08_land_8_20_14_0_20_40_16]|uniref:Bacterial Ig-like domain-containing protein n=1 Tax=Candidatus Kerfeldbacteria bacterium CG08_land_8_20_14_0_20_40_16 TaxID=2014244 RepID=A0A2H0YXK1_9BACT|nr:MAG: hypothetical protein COT24_03355 [Candidatus Kerfeldbacteria bacterium CG08_land_8_20_14_0_20_40_16]
MKNRLSFPTLIFIIAISSFVIASICSFSLFFLNPKIAQGANVIIALLEPSNNAFLSGNIQATAQTNVTVPRVEFHFVEVSGRFAFVYNGNNIGGNRWQYTWSTNQSIDGIYRVYAVAVDNDNYSYLSEFNNIIVNNTGEIPPVPDQNINGNPPVNTNANVNENINGTNGNENVNGNYNINENNNLNSTPPSEGNLNQNQNQNINSNINVNLNQNLNQNSNNNINLNTNTPLTNTPPENNVPKRDDDNDNLPNEEELQNGTDPNDPDSDDDGLTDDFEIKNGFDPLRDDNATPKRTADINIIQAIDDARKSNGVDTDQDGLPDTVEEKIGGDPNDPDTSNDGLTDGFKAQYGYSLTYDNSDFITKIKNELNLINVNEVEKTSYLTAGIILGFLLVIAVVVLILFHPKKI